MNRQQRRKAERERQKEFDKRVAKIRQSQTDEVTRAGLLIGEAQREATVEILNEGKTLDKVKELFFNAVGYAEGMVTTVHEKLGQQPAYACRAGCAWCCYQLVEVTPLEAVILVEYLRATLPEDDFAALRDQVAGLDGVTRGMNQDERFELRRPCALLDAQGRCRAYDVRPLACRGYNSTDADKCREAVDKVEEIVDTLADSARLKFFGFAAMGLQKGISDTGLQGDTLELTAALRLVMEDSQIGDRWLQGEPVFEEAKTADNSQSPRARRQRINLLGGGA